MEEACSGLALTYVLSSNPAPVSETISEAASILRWQICCRT